MTHPDLPGYGLATEPDDGDTCPICGYHECEHCWEDDCDEPAEDEHKCCSHLIATI
jgi:hypothetical protein